MIANIGGGNLIAARSVGDEGPAVVIVPGLAVSRYLRATQDLLAERAVTHLLQFPGTGDAADPPGPTGLAEDAAAVADWMRQHLPGKAVLAGHSYGTQVGLRVTLLVPELVGGLVLGGPTVDPAYRSWWRLLMRWLVDFSREPRGLVRFQRPEQRRAGFRRVVRMTLTMVADDPEVWVRRIDVPITVVRGERDPMCTRDWAARLVVKPGRLVEIPDAPHAFPYGHADEMAEAVMEAVELMAGRKGGG